MSELVFREIRNDVVRHHGNCPPVVELFFNEPLLAELAAGQRKDPPYESCLLHIRWENDDVYKDVYSAISVQPRLSSPDFNGRLAMHLDAGGSVVYDFINTMHQCFHAQLVQVMLNPATFIFQHEAKDSVKEMAKQRKILGQTFKALLSDIPNCQTEITIRPAKKPVEYAPMWRCFTSSNTASQSSTGDKTTTGTIGLERTLNKMQEDKEQPFDSMATEPLVCKGQLRDVHHQIEHQDNSNETLVGDTVAEEHTNAVQYQEGNKNKQEKMFSSSSDKSNVFSGCLDEVHGSDEDSKAEKIPDFTKTSVVEEQLNKSQPISSFVSRSDKATKDEDHVGQDIGADLEQVIQKKTKQSEDLNKSFQTESSDLRAWSPAYHLPEDDHSVQVASQENAFFDNQVLMSENYSAQDISRKQSIRGTGTLFDLKKKESSGWNSGLYNRKTNLQGQGKIKSGTEDISPTRYESDSPFRSRNNAPRMPVGSSGYDHTQDLGYDPLFGSEYFDQAHYSSKTTWTKPNFRTNKLHVGLESATRTAQRLMSSRATEVDCARQEPRRRHHVIDKTASQYSELRKYVTSIPVSVVKESLSENPREYATQILYQLREIVGNTYGNIWSAAEEMATKDLPNAPRDKNGTDTVLCLDISGSAHSDDVRQLKSVVLKFLDGVEELAETQGLEENICITTLGGDPKILHPFSNDYESLRDTVGAIDGNGFAPWINNVFTCVSALSKGNRCEMGECILVPPRVIIITSGFSMEKQLFLHNRQSAELFFTALAHLGVQLIKDRLVGSITLVPYGDSGQRNMTFMETATRLCNGQVVNDIRLTCSHQKLHRVSAQICRYIMEEYSPIDYSFEIADLIIAEVCCDFSSEDLDKVADIVEGCFDELLGQFSNTRTFDNIHKSDLLPRLGTRVIRGPDWQWGDQGEEGAGTIINHGRYGGTLWVLWDNGHCNVYRYGLQEYYDVLITDDRPRIPDVEGEVYIGMQVERGPHWHDNYVNQDGGPGSFGSVIRKRGRRVGVIWPTDQLLIHSFGVFDRFEVCIRDPRDLLPKSEKTSFINSNLTDEPPVPPESLGPCVWQWFDASVSQWTPYSDGNDAKLKSSYQKRPEGSCLVQRNGHSFRVFFKTLQEKEIAGDLVTKVRRKPV